VKNMDSRTGMMAELMLSIFLLDWRVLHPRQSARLRSLISVRMGLLSACCRPKSHNPLLKGPGLHLSFTIANYLSKGARHTFVQEGSQVILVLEDPLEADLVCL